MSLAGFVSPLSQSDSHEGREKALFGNIEHFQSGRGIERCVHAGADLCVPSPLAGEGQGEGDIKPETNANGSTLNSTPTLTIFHAIIRFSYLQPHG